MGFNSNLNWRFIYFLTIGFRFVFALSNSYIHPDEHFQSFEVLAKKFFNYDTTIPWEFDNDYPARSLGPLYLFYGPLFYIVKSLNLDLSMLQIWYLARLQLVIIGWLITDMCIYRLLPTKPERIKAVFFTSTSYVTLVYQSHCFSNSIETSLVLISLVIIDDLRYLNEMTYEDSRKHDRKPSLFSLGLLMAVGMFNRITFPVFVLLPSIFLLQYLWKNKTRTLPLISGLIIGCISMVLIDIVGYGRDIEGVVKDPFNTQNYVFTPINNLLYNSKFENLSHHGIHPLYTHVFINLPQLIGPGLLFVLGKGKNKYYKTTPFLSWVGAVFFLSFIPHQELRFLIPCLPLLCCCFDLESLSGASSIRQTKKATDSPPYVKSIFYSWYIFNASMAILMGVYHQGGIVDALGYFKTDLMASSKGTIQIWWRTYNPPTWLLESSSLETIKIDDSSKEINLSPSIHHHLVDAMGSDFVTLHSIIDIISDTFSQHSNIYLVIPTATLIDISEDLQSCNLIWKFSSHLDMDHLDLVFKKGFHPGLSILEIL